jgi:hypothetical protein
MPIGQDRRKTLFRVWAVLLILSALFILLYYSGIVFSCMCSNAPSIQVNGITLHSGPLPTNSICSTTNSEYILLSLSNPFSAQNLTSFALRNSTGGSAANTMYEYYLRGGNTCTQISLTREPGITGSTWGLFSGTRKGVTNLTLYFASGQQTSSALVSGQYYFYAINFSNYNSVSGSLQAQ